jgi:hypothetical protein
MIESDRDRHVLRTVSDDEGAGETEGQESRTVSGYRVWVAWAMRARTRSLARRQRFVSKTISLSSMRSVRTDWRCAMASNKVEQEFSLSQVELEAGRWHCWLAQQCGGA